MRLLIFSEVVLLTILLTAALLGSCVKRIDWKDANVGQLTEVLCPEAERDLSECEADLKECHKDQRFGGDVIYGKKESKEAEAKKVLAH